MQGIENLTICVRRGDWWWNEHNVELVMEWNKFKDSFREMDGLKRLVMQLESSDDKRGELLGIVEQAKKRRFRLQGGGVLVPREEVGEEVWQSGFDYVSCLFSFFPPFLLLAGDGFINLSAFLEAC